MLTLGTIQTEMDYDPTTDSDCCYGNLFWYRYPCDQFEATTAYELPAIRDRIAGFGVNLDNFVVAGKASVNGCGTVGSALPNSATPRVPDEWAFIKSRMQV